MGDAAATSEADEPLGVGTGAHARAGAVIAGKYRIFATLGRGGMADVFLAAAQGPGGFMKLVVLKKLRGGRGEDPAFVTMFLDEARLSARLNHPNVVHTYEVGEDGDVYFIAMEYLEGQPLHRIAKEMAERGGRLAPTMAAHILAEALRGLDHAHEMKDYDGSPLGIVHRDVSPQNLHVAYDGQVRVLDFGIAKAALNTSHTQTGVLKGKFAYMSPEQTTGDPVDRRSDVFAAGIILWEVLAGQRLFRGDNAFAITQLVLGHVDPPSSRCAEIPPELDAIVMRALQRDPDERYATAQEFANALDDFVHSTGTRVRREEVARCLKELFGGAQERIQRQINTHVAALALAPSPSSSPAPSFSILPAIQTGSHVASLAPPSLAASSSGFTALPPTVAEGVLRSNQVAPPPALALSTLAELTPHRRASAASYVLIAIGMLAVVAVVAVLLTRPRTNGTTASADSGRAPVQAGSASSTAASGDSLHLTLSSDPLEAQVEWDGKVVGHTPMLIDLLPGPQSFVLSREGYFSTSIVLTVSESMAGSVQSRTVVLMSRGAPPAAIAKGPEPRGRRAGANGKRTAVPDRAVETTAPSEQPAPPDPRLATTELAVAPPAPGLAATPAPPTSVSAPPAAPPAVAPPPPAAASVLPFGPDMSRPVLLSGSEPAYTREAALAKVEGTVIARCTITVAGTLESCRILKGLPFMDRSMLDALATRRYTPVVYQGHPVAVEYVFNVKLVAPR